MAITITKPTSQVGITSNISIYSMSPAFNPPADSMILVFTHASGTVTGSISGTATGFNIIGTFNPQALGNSARLFMVNYAGAPPTAALNIDYTGDAATGACAVALQLTGQERGYIRQFAQANSIGTNPVLTFPLPTNTNNAVIMGVMLNTSLGVFTPPAGWSTVLSSYDTPRTGLAVAHMASGVATTTITFSTGSAIGLAFFGLEVWAQGNIPAGDPLGMSGMFG